MDASRAVPGSAAGADVPRGQDLANPMFARFFDRFGGRNEERGQAELRDELVAGLTGRVVEIGPGNGLNFSHYPAAVEKLTAVEPEPYLRGKAREAAQAAAIEIDVVDGTASGIPAEDSSFDAAVVSGVLCSVPDPAAALAEIGRVLRPGGELRFYEHVRSRHAAFARLQDAVDVLWPRLMGGCHCNRDTLETIRNAGYTTARVRGLIFPPQARISVVSPRILGTAHPRATGAL